MFKLSCGIEQFKKGSPPLTEIFLWNQEFALGYRTSGEWSGHCGKFGTNEEIKGARNGERERKDAPAFKVCKGQRETGEFILLFQRLPDINW